MRSVIFLLSFIAIWCQCSGQAQYNFRRLDASHGLSDGVVRAIGQDKYGYIWVATLSGINRFDGYSVKSFYHDVQDSLSIPPGNVRNIFCDSKGRLWIATAKGLVQYDYATSRFTPIRIASALTIIRMVENAAGQLCLATTQGPALLEPTSGTVTKPGSSDRLLNRRINDLFLSGTTWFMASDTGLILYDPATGKTSLQTIPYPDKGIRQMATDKNGTLWLSTGDNGTRIVKTDLRFSKFRADSSAAFSPSGTTDGAVLRMLVDRKGRFWYTSSLNGLVRFDDASQKMIPMYNDPLRPTSLTSNHVTELFEDNAGFLWVGSEGNGLNYFHPDRNLFQVLAPPLQLFNEVPALWARAFIVDRHKQSWMGLGGGLVRIDSNGSSSYYHNTRQDPSQLHYNSIRSLLEDKDGNIWIGTGKGVNLYDPRSRKIEFLNEKDSLPLSFYWSIVQDSRGIIWFGERDNLFYRDPVSKKIRTVEGHPVLSAIRGRGVHCIFEDSKKRLWFGMNGSGLVMYDPAKAELKQWKRSAGTDTSLLNNSIVAIAEDQRGLIWTSSFTGLCAYDPQIAKFKWYTQKNGLPALKTSGLLVDDRDRLWIGSTGGLLMLDSSRRIFRTFDLQDGLPAMEFSDMPGTRLADGRFVFPTMKGFVAFNPGNYRSNETQTKVYISSLRFPGSVEIINPEDLTELNLEYDRNFFTLQLTGFNYNNPDQTWYAYKLDGFDRDWIITKERIINYTNVPGGNYIFRYKASTDPNHWEVEEKTLHIHIATVFYKAAWFWILLLVATTLLLWYLYKKRIAQQRRMFRLQTRAQALEKEKAAVMYESLKQQLNPHFLFNSLTSLASLIRVNQKLAGEFLTGLSRIYRYILQSRDAESVPLGEELKFLESYILLQKTRFAAGFDVSIDVPAEYHDRRIVPVTLQNLVENAMKHNIIDEEYPLLVNIRVEHDWLIVSNNLNRKSFVETSNKQGLEQLKSLYRYLSSKPVQVIDNEQEFIIKLPLL